MNEKYFKYYLEYLTVNEEEMIKGKKVFSSKQRDITLNRKYYYQVICTQINHHIIFSVTPSLYYKLNKYLDKKVIKNLNDAKEILTEFLNMECPDGEMRAFKRFGYEGPSKSINDRVQVLSEEGLKRRIKNLSDENQLIAIKRRSIDIKEKRQFEIIENSQLASFAKISDIDFNGGNIVLYTNEAYRRKGYGKVLVNACINYCINKNILPVYLVDVNNIPSINLAKSLGFHIISEEILVSITP